MGDEIKVRDVVFLTMTIDRRFLDGMNHAEIYKKFVAYLDDPAKCATADS